MTPRKKPALRYVGDGTALPDVPARDLPADEAERYDRDALIASGLYEAAAEADITNDAPPAAAESEADQDTPKGA